MSKYVFFCPTTALSEVKHVLKHHVESEEIAWGSMITLVTPSDYLFQVSCGELGELCMDLGLYPSYVLCENMGGTEMLHVLKTHMPLVPEVGTLQELLESIQESDLAVLIKIGNVLRKATEMFLETIQEGSAVVIIGESIMSYALLLGMVRKHELWNFLHMKPGGIIFENSQQTRVLQL